MDCSCDRGNRQEKLGGRRAFTMNELAIGVATDAHLYLSMISGKGPEAKLDPAPDPLFPPNQTQIDGNWGYYAGSIVSIFSV